MADVYLANPQRSLFLMRILWRNIHDKVLPTVEAHCLQGIEEDPPSTEEEQREARKSEVPGRREEGKESQTEIV